MKKTILMVLVLLVLAAAGVYMWLNWGPQLAALPGQIAGRTTQILTGMFGGLASFGQGLANSFKGVVP